MISSCHIPPFLMVLAFLLCSPSQHAYAFQRTTADGPNGNVHLFWEAFPLRYYINQNGSRDIPNKQATFDAVKASFQTWMLPECTCFQAEFAGFTNIAEAAFNEENPDEDQNIVFFRTGEWEHNAQAVAVTSVIFSRSTGKIFGFDIEMNDRGFTFSLDGQPIRNVPAPVKTIDFQNTLTHEVGHALGLDHSSTREATMFASAPPGETSKRELHPDDIEGVCGLYRKQQIEPTCIIDRTEAFNKGCGCQSQSTPPLSPLLGLFLLLFLRRKNHS